MKGKLIRTQKGREPACKLKITGHPLQSTANIELPLQDWSPAHVPLTSLPWFPAKSSTDPDGDPWG